MTPHPLIAYLALTHGVTLEQVLSRSRRAEVSRVRALACYLLYKSQEYNLSATARLLGIDRASVLYAVRRVQADPVLREDAQASMRVLRTLARAAG